MEEIIFKISADAKQADKETDKLEASLEAVNEAAENLMKTNKGLDASFEDVYGDIKPLSGRLGELEDRMYELALAGQQNTEEFRELQEEAVKYRQTLISVDKSVDQLAEQGRGLGAALQIGSAVVAGYGAVQGAQALLGSESKELEKVFIKLQAVQTILASLEQLKLSLDKQSIIVTKAKAASTYVAAAAQTLWTTVTAGTTAAMGALKIAMLAIPIVAIIAGIVALVAALASFMKASETAEKSNNKFNKSLEKTRRAMDLDTAAALKNSENKIKLAKAQGKSIQEIHELERMNLGLTELARRNELKVLKGTIDTKRKLLKRARKEGNKELSREIFDEIVATRQKYAELKILDNDYFVDREILVTEHNNAIAEEEKAAAEERAKNWEQANKDREKREADARKKQLERDKLLRDLIIENIEDEGVRKMTALEENQKRETAQLIEKYGEDTILIEQLERKQADDFIKLTKELEEKRKAEQEKVDKQALAEKQKQAELVSRDRRAQIEGELIQMRDDFNMRMQLEREFAQFERDQIINDLEVTNGEKFKAEQEYAQKIADLDQQEADRKKELERQTAEAVKSIYDSSFTAISNLADGIFALRIANADAGSKKELELQKKAFKFNKSLQIANATMQGIQAVQGAFSTAQNSPITALLPAYPFLQAAAAGVFALGNIAKIKATTFQGGGSVGSTSVSAPTVGTPTADTGQEDTTTLTSGLEGSGQTQQTQVVLVDSDVKAAMMASNQVEVISTLGE